MADNCDIIGGFKILRDIQVGSGSQGTVHMAQCVEDVHSIAKVGTIVAIKVMSVLDEGMVLWRRLEARTKELCRLDHPNVVRYLGCFHERKSFRELHVVVQEFLEGETLKERIATNPGGLDADEAMRIADAALAGLEYTASKGIVHRDIKPGNIFLCRNGGVKLIDFEIARQSDDGTATASTGNIRGSFDYMAPDFTQPDFRGDVKSDIFSMGAVIHEALTGQTPYQRIGGEGSRAYFEYYSRWTKALSGEHDPIFINPRINRLLDHAERVIRCAVETQRDNRYADFTAFRKALAGITYIELKGSTGKYRLLQFIGRGGFGEVFKARDLASGGFVAVKHLLKGEYAERFYREAKIMAKLCDPCFVRLVDFFTLDDGSGEAFLVMDFLPGMPGSSLRDAIARSGEGMPKRTVLSAFERYARGLAMMHENGIIHRDIKPSNLYYPEGHPERAAIMDFGIARDIKGTMTSGNVPGTLDYMPPEVVISENRGGSGMDVYALGLCLYEALSGKTGYTRLPTGTAAYAALFERARQFRPPTFDDARISGDAPLMELLRGMTEPVLGQRITSADEVVKKIHKLIRSLPDDELVIPPQSEPDAPTSPTAIAEIEKIRKIYEGKGSIPVPERDPSHEKSDKSRHSSRLMAAAVLIVLAVVVAGVTRQHWGNLPLPWANVPISTPAMFDADSEASARLKAEEDARLKAEEEERLREEAHRKAEEEARIRAEKEARIRAEEERRLAEERRRAQEKEAELQKLREQMALLEEEKSKAEAERRQIAAEKAKAEEAERHRLEEERNRIAEEQAKIAAEKQRLAEAMAKAEAEAEEARRKAEEAKKAEEEARKQREAEEARLREDEARRRAEEAQRRAEEARKAEAARKAEEDERKRREAENAAQEAAKRQAAKQQQRQTIKAIPESVKKARLYYDEALYADAVKFYYEAFMSGYSLSADDTTKFDHAFSEENARLKALIDRCYKLMNMGKTLTRPLKDIEDERRQLLDYRNSVKGL